MPSRLEEFVAQRERKAEKLKALIALLRDPDLAEDVEALLQERQQTAQSSPVIAPAAAASHNGNGNGQEPSIPQGITDALISVGPHLPTPFTIKLAVDYLADHGYYFARDPQSTVRDALYWACRTKNPKFRVVNAGRGGRESTFEFAGDGFPAGTAAESPQF